MQQTSIRRRPSHISSLDSTQANQPSFSKSPSWSAGPTKSAKEGIAREWLVLQLKTENLCWSNDQNELGQTSNPRELGRRLLFTQLEALIPYWSVDDTECVQEVGEMLVGRWVESGRMRTNAVQYITTTENWKVHDTGGGMTTRVVDTLVPFHL